MGTSVNAGVVESTGPPITVRLGESVTASSLGSPELAGFRDVHVRGASSIRVSEMLGWGEEADAEADAKQSGPAAEARGGDKSQLGRRGERAVQAAVLR